MANKDNTTNIKFFQWIFALALVLTTITILTIIAFAPLLAPSQPILTPTIYLNNQPVDLANLPKLTAGRAVKLKILITDDKQITYPDSQLSCSWSVSPINDNDGSINTDLCEIIYKVSESASHQTFQISVRHVEARFEQLDIQPLTFEITNNKE